MHTRRAIWLVAPFAVMMLAATSAQALPSPQPDITYMVDGAVRSIVQVQPPGQNLIWLGGQFAHVLKNPKTTVATVDGLAVLDDTTGQPASGVHVPILGRATGDPIVFDMALSPDGSALYLAGQFNTVDGVARKNVAAIDPATGALLPFAPKAQPANSIAVTSTNVFVGGLKLVSYLLSGTPTPGYTPPVAVIDPGLRFNVTKPTFRDIEVAGTALVAACQCDAIDDVFGSHPTKALVQIDATTGFLLPWTPSNLNTDSGAFGIDAVIGTDPLSGLPTVYLAAGGSDFAAAYDLATGTQIWKTDTSGSSQAIAIYQGVIIDGGHFEWTESPTTPQCGKNTEPTPGCYHSPRLVALDPSTGAVLLDPSTQAPWNPGICCIYQGVWALAADASGTSVHVGGVFTKAGGHWQLNGSTGVWDLVSFAKQRYYARFSDPPPSP